MPPSQAKGTLSVLQLWIWSRQSFLFRVRHVKTLSAFHSSGPIPRCTMAASMPKLPVAGQDSLHTARHSDEGLDAASSSITHSRLQGPGDTDSELWPHHPWHHTGLSGETASRMWLLQSRSPRTPSCVEAPSQFKDIMVSPRTAAEWADEAPVDAAGTRCCQESLGSHSLGSPRTKVRAMT